MRVGILGIQHESNTFLSEPTTMPRFRSGVFLCGEEIRSHFSDAHHELGGFFEGLENARIEAAPLFFTFAMPSGVVTAATLEALWEMAREELNKAMPLDGILAAPHGAAVAESHPDMDGWWLGELRKEVGPEVPIVAVIDPHANLTPAMIAATNAMIAYRENPHVDQRQRGREAADLLARTLRGEVRPVTAGNFMPLAINIERQLTTAEPLLALGRELDRVRGWPGVLSASLIMGYPYADVEEMGSSFVVVTDDDRHLAEALARKLADWTWDRRERFRGHLISPEEALRQAESAPKPVALLDMGDNMGGGASADSTVLAALCHEKFSTRNTFVCLHDPQSVQKVEEAGLEARITLRMGGKHAASPAPPLEAEVTVQGLYDGRYSERQPRHGGVTDFDMGRIAIVTTTSGLTVMLTTHRAFPTSANQMLAFGLKPEAYERIILKGVHSPVAGYREHCPSMIRVNTPGVTTADMEKLGYVRRRKPLFPLEG